MATKQNNVIPFQIPDIGQERCERCRAIVPRQRLKQVWFKSSAKIDNQVVPVNAMMKVCPRCARKLTKS